VVGVRLPSLNGDIKLDPANFAGMLATESQAAPAPLKLEDSTTVVVKSTPSGAAFVDGNFVGSTPSTLPLTPGDHRFSVERWGMTFLAVSVCNRSIRASH
jgi:PEGA domain